MNRQTLVAWNDMLHLLLIALIMIVVVAVAAIRPPSKSDTMTSPPGSLQVLITWPDGSTADIDLWVLTPNGEPVGFSHKGGALGDLLRDDRGILNDTSGKNFEFFWTRGLTPGQYVVNLDLWALYTDHAPIPVTVVVGRYDATGHYDELWVEQVALQDGPEVTIRRFTLDADGNITTWDRVATPVAYTPPEDVREPTAGARE